MPRLTGRHILVLLAATSAAAQAAAPHERVSPQPESAPGSAGSAYVPIDSWIYAALDRLAALGLIGSQASGLRPWTRLECRRQAAEAQAALNANPRLAPVLAREAAEVAETLRRELDEARPGPRIVLESFYLNNTLLAGPVLNDSFHFGQTLRNDFGRPFARGWTAQAGFTTRAESGRFFAYTRAEVQHAPATPEQPPSIRELVSTLDGIPVQNPKPSTGTGRFRAVEAYMGIRLWNLEFSAGKQSLWWGPTYDAPLSFSANAEPTKNVKISTVHPFRPGGPLSIFGDIRAEFAMGKLGGHEYTWRPWFNAQKLSFKVTKDLEMGFTRWSIFWGVGHPITMRSFLRNFASTYSPNGAAGVGANDPGDRKSGFDFRYRIPGARNWLTLYTDSYSDDDPSPLAAPRRAAINPGLYLSHFPGVPRLDLRVEAPSTELMRGDTGGQFLYYNSQYRSGNTNYGVLLGNPVGRDGRAIEAWSTYWLSARNRLQFGYRQLKTGDRFLPGGGTQTDALARLQFQLAQNWNADVNFQRERFLIPVLGPARANTAATLRLTWEPALNVLQP